MKKRPFRFKQKTASFGQMFGVELFWDSCLLRVVVCQLHYDTVEDTCECDATGDVRADDAPPFPLADVADPGMTNANVVLYLLRQHRADERIHLVRHHRYFHRDSQDPSDGLDLKRTYVHTIAVLDEHGIDALVLDFCRFVGTDDHFTLCARPEVYDFAGAPIDVAMEAWLKLPFIHTRVMVDGGVQ